MFALRHCRGGTHHSAQTNAAPPAPPAQHTQHTQHTLRYGPRSWVLHRAVAIMAAVVPSLCLLDGAIMPGKADEVPMSSSMRRPSTPGGMGRPGTPSGRPPTPSGRGFALGDRRPSVGGGLGLDRPTTPTSGDGLSPRGGPGAKPLMRPMSARTGASRGRGAGRGGRGAGCSLLVGGWAWCAGSGARKGGGAE
jgi:hypothetical protein